MHSPLERPGALASYVDRLWEEVILQVLSSYVGIKCLSPDFDQAWAQHGEIGRAARASRRLVRDRVPSPDVPSRSSSATA